MTIELTRLPSGLTIVTDNMPHLETASLGVWVAAGSRDETPEENGISHFLERSRAPTGARHGRSQKRSNPSAATSTPRPASKPRRIMRGC